MNIYNTPNNAFQMTVETRLQGWQVQVSYWNGEDFEIRYDAYAIAESLWEACLTALCSAGFDSETADWQLAEWEIYSPEEEEFYACVTCGESMDGPDFNPFQRECETCETL